MLGKSNASSPLETLALRYDNDEHEEEIIKAFFPHASITAHSPLETPKI